MAVPTTFAELSTTASSNPPADSEAVSQGDDQLRQIYAFIRSLYDDKASLNAAATFTAITGTTISGTSVALSAQPAFFAYRSSSQTSGTTCIFDTERYDQGGVYNNSTGVFTAPSNGLYFFSAVVEVFNNTGAGVQGEIRLMVDGSTSFIGAMTPGFSETGATYSLALSGAVKLTAGQTVSVLHTTTFSATVIFQGSTGATKQGSSTFSGYLLG